MFLILIGEPYTTISFENRSMARSYWTAPRNTTEWSVTMTELTKSGNAISKLMLQALAPTLPGAHIGALKGVSGVIQPFLMLHDH